MLWKTIRELEKKLNGPQPEHFVYIIKDSELMSGVTYMFNVTGASHEGNTTKTFSIDYNAGDQKLLDVEGRSDKFSLQLLGGQTTYPDLGLIIEAKVTTCTHTQDYYFEWTLTDKKNNVINVTESGLRLVVPAFVLEAGQDYTVRCQVIKKSNEKFITESALPIQVLYRDLEVYMSVDRLTVTIGKEFSLSSYINPNYEEQYLKLEWKCFYNNEECTLIFDVSNSNTVCFSKGLLTAGEYLITVTVSDVQRSAAANTTIIAVDKNLPVIEVAAQAHTVNEGSEVYLVANVSNLIPFCTLAWYITNDENLISNNETSEDFQSVLISEITTIFSLEQSFLNEIADYTNETEQREVAASVTAFAGRARLVANCSGDDDDAVSYADVYFKLNESPKIGKVMVTPESGVALETLYRISTSVAMDNDKPVIYSFYCKVADNDTLLLGSYLDHYAVETYLPYIHNGTGVFVVACDSLNACSTSTTHSVDVQKHENNMKSIEDLSAHARRCEMLQLMRLAVSAFVTFDNGSQMDKVSLVTEKIIDILPSVHLRCVPSEDYMDILANLAQVGVLRKDA
ncbi:uncharacterized protein LOC121726129 [Aricia agestis]|uniref:uncharacterized protein LOC121726129 n=1 Tax=Aricia agestis TaxID=91739 RepID=UPI001C20AE84|nr:uncharacterized protein LOC121726129 [Aricia agestis]